MIDSCINHHSAGLSTTNKDHSTGKWVHRHVLLEFCQLNIQSHFVLAFKYSGFYKSVFAKVDLYCQPKGKSWPILDGVIRFEYLLTTVSGCASGCGGRGSDSGYDGCRDTRSESTDVAGGDGGKESCCSRHTTLTLGS